MYVHILYNLSFVTFGIVAAQASPVVTLDSAKVTGTVVNSGAIEEYLGIPYALSPWARSIQSWRGCTLDLIPLFRVGDLRYRLPKPISSYTQDLNATEYGPYCPQHASVFASIPSSNATVPQSEDCLTINVVKPASASATTLPVVAVRDDHIYLNNIYSISNQSSVDTWRWIWSRGVGGVSHISKL